MDYFEKLTARRWNAEGKDRPVPQRGAKRYFFLLGTHFWKLVAGNLLFLLFSIPVVTLPASLAALNRVCIKLVRDGNCLLWQEFWEEWKKGFASSLLLGLPYGLGFAASYYFFSLGLSNAQGVYGVLFTALGLIALIVSSLYGSWTFVLKAMLELPNRDICRNARTLTVLEGKRDLMILGVLLASGAFTVLLFPISLFAVVLILPAVTQLAVCSFINPPVQTRVIAPFEEARSKQTLPPVG